MEAAVVFGQHLLGDVVVFEALDVLQAALDALFTAFGSGEGAEDGAGKGFVVVGMDVEAVGTSRFFEARPCGGYDGQTALDGFDDGNAESFVARGIDEAEGLLVDGGQMVVGYVAEQMDAICEAVALGKGEYLFAHVAGLPSYEYEVERGRGKAPSRPPPVGEEFF